MESERDVPARLKAYKLPLTLIGFFRYTLVNINRVDLSHDLAVQKSHVVLMNMLQRESASWGVFRIELNEITSE